MRRQWAQSAIWTRAWSCRLDSLNLATLRFICAQGGLEVDLLYSLKTVAEHELGLLTYRGRYRRGFTVLLPAGDGAGVMRAAARSPSFAPSRPLWPRLSTNR